MTTIYTVIKNMGGETISIRRGDGASIPVCEGNRDYIQYLEDTSTSPAPIEVIPDPEPSDPEPTIQELQEQLAATNAVILDMLLG